MDIKKLCAPAIVYLVFSIISIFASLAQSASLGSTVMQAIMIIFWTWLIQYLCTNGYKTLSWILVLFPIIIAIIFILLIMSVAGIASVAKIDTVPMTTPPTKR
jgi:hypothetical protein